VRGGVASLRDDSPCASAKGAKGAERDRLVVQVEVLGLDDGVVVLVLARAISVGGETTFHGGCAGLRPETQGTRWEPAMRASMPQVSVHCVAK